MLTYDLSERGSLPIYEFLTDSIRRDIQNGALKKGERLPSKRSFAANLGVSVITIQNAYAQLSDEGYVESREKSGYFVADIELLNFHTASTESAERLRIDDNKDCMNNADVTTTAAAKVKKGNSEGIYENPVNAAAAGSDDTLQETKAEMKTYRGFDHFPYTIWSRITRNVLLDQEQYFMRKPESTGVPELRKAIAEHLFSFRGLKVPPDNIIVGAGTEYLYGLAVQIIGRNGMIAVEDPGHTKISSVYESNGVKVIYIPVDDEGLVVSELYRNHAAAVHVSPAHQFPTGAVMPASRRYQLLNWAAEHQAYVIEDDYDSEFRFSGRPVRTLTEIAPDRVIYMNTFSKTLSPSVRIAYMVLPDKLMRRFRSRLGFYSSTVSAIDQYTLAEFISKQYYARHLNRMVKSYRNYRKQFLDIISGCGDGLMRVVSSDCGLHITLKINEGADASGAHVDNGGGAGAVRDYADNKGGDRIVGADADNDGGADMIEKCFSAYGISLIPISAYSRRGGSGYRRCYILNYAETDIERFRKACDELKSGESYRLKF